jgi:TatA/E family protein of Tat protein translocase
MLGVPELIVLVAVALLLFGSSIPSLARWLGQGVTQVRKEVKELEQITSLPPR